MIYPNRKRGNRKLVVLVGPFQEREAGTLGAHLRGTVSSWDSLNRQW